MRRLRFPYVVSNRVVGDVAHSRLTDTVPTQVHFFGRSSDASSDNRTPDTSVKERQQFFIPEARGSHLLLQGCCGFIGLGDGLVKDIEYSRKVG